MNTKSSSSESGQSLVLVAAALVALVIFVAITVDVSSAYYHRRTAQNGADGAALAGVRELGTQINNKKKLDKNIQIWMNDFAEKNDIQDTDGTLANEVNGNVDGWYTDAEGNRLDGEPKVGGGDVPDDAYGIEAITTITAPTYFGGILGFDGYRLNARAVSVLRALCAQDCVVPIATNDVALCGEEPTPEKCQKMAENENRCLNIWNGYDEGNFGWLNWTWQELVCEAWERPACPVPQGTNACDAPALSDNLNPDNCASGFIEVDDWASGAVGVINADVHVQDWLDYYLGLTDGISHTFTTVIWDYTSVISPYNTTALCNAMDDGGGVDLGENWGSAGLHYHVAGFAVMQIIGYQLSNGTSVGVDPSLCEDVGVKPDKEGFRISAKFLLWVDDPVTNEVCRDPLGTMLSSPRLIE